MVLSSRTFCRAAVGVLFCCVCGAAGGASSPPGTLTAVYDALMNRDYEAAVTTARALSDADASVADSAVCLQALALHHADRVDESLGVLEAFMARFPDSPWHRKAMFLKAENSSLKADFRSAAAIYRGQQQRLLGPLRSEELASVLVSFADSLAAKSEKTDPAVPPADYRRAVDVYDRALGLGIDAEMRARILLKKGRTLRASSSHEQAIAVWHTYLAEFDPDWDPVRACTAVRPRPQVAAGSERFEARYQLALTQMAARQYSGARAVLLDLQRLLAAEDDGGGILGGHVAWALIQAYRLLEDPTDRLQHTLRATRAFLARHASHPRAVQAAFLLPGLYRRAHLPEKALEAYHDFINGKSYRLPSKRLANQVFDDVSLSPAELETQNRMTALYNVGQIHFAEGRYDTAIKVWERYLTKYPRGPHWSRAHGDAVNARFLLGLEAVARGDHGEAQQALDAFVRANPLVDECRNALFVLGQMNLCRGEAAEQEASPERAERFYREAVREWAKLIGRFPDSDQAREAQLRTALLHESKLGEIDRALAGYRGVVSGERLKEAQDRLRTLTSPSLAVTTDRVFRTSEDAEVVVRARNIRTVTVKQYNLDLEDFFRKHLCILGVEDLDVSLIQPDKTWDLELADYQDCLLREQRVSIPFPSGEPGVCVVNVSSREWEATTLVVRSDLDVALRSNQRAFLVFVQHTPNRKPVHGARVLLSDGTRIIASGATDETGVFRGELSGGALVRGALFAFASSSDNVCAADVDIQSLNAASGLTPRGYLYTDRPVYRPGAVVGIRAIVRDVRDDRYVVPVDRAFSLEVAAPDGRVIFRSRAMLSDAGTLAQTLRLPADLAPGTYAVSARALVRPGAGYSVTFDVRPAQTDPVLLDLALPEGVQTPGEAIAGRVTVRYSWGQPAVDIGVHCEMPDGRRLLLRSDLQGRAAFSFDTAGYAPGAWLAFQARLEGREAGVNRTVQLAPQGYSISAMPAHRVVLAAEPVALTFRTVTWDGAATGRKLKVVVLRKGVEAGGDVLARVPWLRHPAVRRVPTVVERHDVETDPRTGLAQVTLSVVHGGDYIVQVTGRDELGATVAAETTFRVSASDDPVKLRFLAPDAPVRVGEKLSVRLHSRLGNALALLTQEGDTFVGHELLDLDRGYNPITLGVGHAHYPNFQLCALVMQDGRLHEICQPFEVTRQLNVSIEAPEGVATPGSIRQVRLKATDQMGRPVEAEFSLSLTKEDLVADASASVAPVVPFFRPASRPLEFGCGSSVDFEYRADTPDSALLPALSTGSEATDPARVAAGVRPRQEPTAGQESRSHGQAGTSVAPVGFWLPAVATDYKGTAAIELPMPREPGRWRLAAIGCTDDALVGEATAQFSTRRHVSMQLRGPTFLREGDQTQFVARLWNRSAVDREASVELALLLAGKTTVLRESAVLRADAVSDIVFGTFAAGAVGDLSAKATLSGAGLAGEVRRRIRVHPWGFPTVVHTGAAVSAKTAVAVSLPDGPYFPALRMVIRVSADLRCALADAVANAAAWRESYWLTNAPVRHGNAVAASECLTVLTAWREAQAVEGLTPLRGPLRERLDSALTVLCLRQRDDGGWALSDTEAVSDANTTALAYWALAAAQRESVLVPAALLDRARGYLRSVLSGVGALADDTRAAVLHALSIDGQASFYALNRLYRSRSRLGARTLAYTALAFLNLDRGSYGREMLTVLARKAEKTTRDGRQLVCWTPSTPDSVSRHELTSLAVLALSRGGNMPDVQRAGLDWLLSADVFYLLCHNESAGVLAAALAEAGRSSNGAAENTEIGLLVNGTLRKKVTLGGDKRTGTLAVDGTPLRASDNVIALSVNGASPCVAGVTLVGFTPEFRNPEEPLTVQPGARRYLHMPLRHAGRSIPAASTSAVQNVENGQRIQVEVAVSDRARAPLPDRWFVEESLPAGTVLVPGTIEGDFRVVASHPHGFTVASHASRGMRLRYQLAACVPGTYRVLPTVLRNADDPEHVHLGKPSTLCVLAPRVTSPDPYEINDAERFELARANFRDNRMAHALVQLKRLAQSRSFLRQREVNRMLLWAHSDPQFYDAAAVTGAYERLENTFSRTVLPADKIQAVARAYHEQEQFERAAELCRASIGAAFRRDSAVAALLREEGLGTESLALQQRLWWDYPDTDEVASSLLVVPHVLYRDTLAAESDAMDLPQRGPGRVQFPDVDPFYAREHIPAREAVARAADLFELFLALHPDAATADDAAFCLANALLDLGRYQDVARVCAAGMALRPEGRFAARFQYLEALGFFWSEQFDEAAASARPVASGRSVDRDAACYMLAQIHHARGAVPEAIAWYSKVRGVFPDAQDAIDSFREQYVRMPDVASFVPGQRPELLLRHRNVPSARLQVFKVDLMALALRTSLSSIHGVDLAGIHPQAEKLLEFASLEPFGEEQTLVELPVTEEGAYLVMVRADSSVASGLVLVSPLRVAVREDARVGRVRVTVTELPDLACSPGLDVKVIDGVSRLVHAGRTDLRGIFVADGVSDNVTVIVHGGSERYGVYRSSPQSARAMADIRPDPCDGRRAALRRKLSELVLPQLAFEDVPVDRVLRDLSERSREVAADGLGVNVVFYGQYDRMTAPRVTCRFNNTTLRDALRHVCQESNLELRVDSHAVLVAEASHPLGDRLAAVPCCHRSPRNGTACEMLDSTVLLRFDMDSLTGPDFVRALQQRVGTPASPDHGLRIRADIGPGPSDQWRVSMTAADIPLGAVLRYGCIGTGLTYRPVGATVWLSDRMSPAGGAVPRASGSARAMASQLHPDYQRDLRAELARVQNEYIRTWQTEQRRWGAGFAVDVFP